MSGSWTLVPSVNDSKGLGTELSQLSLLSSLASLGPSGILSTEPGGDEDKDHACQGPHTHPVHWPGRSRRSCPRCWCRCCSPGTPSPVRTHRYLPRQCTMAPGQTPRLGSQWLWCEPLSPEQCCPSPVRPAGQGPQPLKGSHPTPGKHPWEQGSGGSWQKGPE